jgi:SPP1 gp7 family putative phage head morphogenesis protein
LVWYVVLISRGNPIGGILRRQPVINKANIQVRIERRKHMARTAKRKSFRRPPRWLYPNGIERQYARWLLLYVDKIQKLTVDILFPALPGLVSQANAMKPVTDSYDENLHDLINALSIQIDQTLPPEWRATTLDIGQKVASWNSAQWQKTLHTVMGVNTMQYEPWLLDDLKSFSRTNVELIKSIKDKTLTDIEVMSQDAIRSGLRHEVIAKQIQEQFQTTKSRARLIARDQVSKLNGQLTEVRQKDLGISEYIWRTTGDERVRRSHAIMDGKRCRWDDPTVYSDDGGKTWKKRASIGGIQKHPGQDYQCRCWAEAVFDQIQEESDKVKNISRSVEPEVVPDTMYSNQETINKENANSSFALVDDIVKLNGNLSNSQIEGVIDYRGGLYEAVEAKLRQGIVNTDKSVAKRTEKSITAMRSVFDQTKLTSKEYTVYRGVGPGDYLKGVKPGSILQDSGFMSTSFNKYLASDPYFLKDGGVRFKIKVPAGSKLVSTGPGQMSEAVLPENTALRVIKINSPQKIKVERAIKKVRKKSENTVITNFTEIEVEVVPKTALEG